MHRQQYTHPAGEPDVNECTWPHELVHGLSIQHHHHDHRHQSPNHHQVATLLLYRCLHRESVDLDTLRLLLKLGASARGTHESVHGLAFRQYCYRYCLTPEARDSLKTPFTPRAGNVTAGLVHCGTFHLGAGVGRCTWLSRQPPGGQLQVVDRNSC